MNDLELFAKRTIEQGGEWWRLEDGLFVSKSKHLVNNNYFYDTLVYQVFNSDGKRLMASTSYFLAYEFWVNLKESEVEE